MQVEESESINNDRVASNVFFCQRFGSTGPVDDVKVENRIKSYVISVKYQLLVGRVWFYHKLPGTKPAHFR